MGFITQHFHAAARIAHMGSLLLMVHGVDDSMVLPAVGRALYGKGLAPKRFVLVPGAVHEDTNSAGLSQYRQALAEFFGLGP